MEGFRYVLDAENVPKVSFTCGAKRFFEISIQTVTKRNVRLPLLDSVWPEWP